MASRTRELIIRICLVLMGVLTATPVVSVVNPSQLESYGVMRPDPIVLTLLQHRGVAQLVLGAALVWSALRADVRVPVAIAATAWKGSFLALTISRPQVLAEANAVSIVFDLICVVLLTAMVIGIALRARRSASRKPVPA